jgi:putative transcriptional regulator
MTMMLSPGTFIQSTNALDNSVFQDVTIYITEFNKAGAMGFVVNKTFARAFNELEEFKHSIHVPMYEGGPVDQEHLYFLHQRPDLIKGGSSVANGIYLGGNMQQAVAGINDKTITGGQIKIFVGYCGWDKGELEAEIEEGSWVVMEGTKDDVFKSFSP